MAKNPKTTAIRSTRSWGREIWIALFICIVATLTGEPKRTHGDSNLPTAVVLLTANQLQASPPTDGEGSVVLSGHTGAVISVAVHPNGQHVLSASDDGTVRGWEVATGQEVLKVSTTKPGGFFCVAISPDGKQFAAGSTAGEINVYEFPSGKLTHRFDGKGKQIQSVAFCPDRQILFSGSVDSSLSWWNLKDGKLQKSIQGNASGVTSVVATPDGKEVLSAGGDGVVRVFNVDTGDLRASWAGRGETIFSLAVSPDGALVASAGGDKMVRVRRLAGQSNEKETHTLEGQADMVMGVGFLPDGKRLVSGGFDKQLILWSLGTKRPLKKWAAHQTSKFGVRSVAVDPKGQFIVSGGYDAKVRIWKLEDLPTTAEVGATVTAEMMSIAPFTVKGAPDYLANAAHLVPNRTEIKPGSSDDYVVSFQQPGALFLRVHALTPSQTPDWHEAMRDRKFKSQGWIPIGKCPWDESSSFWIIPMVEATRVRIKLPPGLRWISNSGEELEDLELLAVADEKYADPKYSDAFGTSYEAMLPRMKAVTLFRAKRWKEIEDILAEARKSQKRFRDGRSELVQLYLGIFPSKANDPAYANLLNEYRRAVPNSAAVKLVDVGIMASRAWDKRGDGTADNVSNEAFGALLDLEKKGLPLLKQAFAVAPTDPQIDCIQLRTIAGGHPTASELKRIVRNGLKKDPWEFALLSEGFVYLLPRWFGESKTASEFAEQLQTEFAKTSGRALYCIAALDVFAWEPDEWETERGFDYQQMLAGLDAFRKQFPENTSMVIESCKAAAYRGDLETARKLYDSLKGPVDLNNWDGDAAAAEWYEFLNPPASTQVLWQAGNLNGGSARLKFDASGGKLYVAATSGHLREFDTRNGKLLSSTSLGFGNVHGIAVTAAGDVIVATTKSLAHFKNGKRSKYVPLEPQLSLWAGRLSPDGRIFAAIDESFQGLLINTASGELLNAIPNVVRPFGSQAQAVEFSPDGKLVVFFGMGTDVVMYDTATGKRHGTLSYGDNLAECIAFHSDGKRLFATGRTQDDKGLVWEWNVETGDVVWHESAPRTQLRRLAVTPDGSRIAAGLDYTYEFLYGAKLWIIGKDQPFDKNAFLPEQRQRIADMAWSPDGTRLAVLGQGGFVRVFNMNSP